MKLSSILGINARAGLIPGGSLRDKRTANSKILTKRALGRYKIPTPEIYKIFRSFADVEGFSWEKLPGAFALKPSKGLGGEGIIVVKKKLKTTGAAKLRADAAPAGSLAEPNIWVTTNRKRVSVDDFKLHTSDILEGAYSVGDIPDVAFCEEYVGRHKAFAKYAYRGTPDVRVVVFNKVPVMSMLRLPTKESNGRANLHQGAIGVGVDIATGITTHAIWYGDYIKYKPVYKPVKDPEQTKEKRKLSGIKIPYWNDILLMASRTQVASGLEYVGVDIVLHPERGPMVLEVNSQPGLQIQLANKAGLRKRLERLEDLEVDDSEHGVRVAKTLFAERFTNRAAVLENIKTIRAFERVRVIGSQGEKKEVRAKVDTGAWRSSIDRKLAKELGLLKKRNILWSKVFKSSLGKEKRNVINLTFYLAGRRINTMVSVATRGDLKRPIIIGRRDLVGFVVLPRRPGFQKPVEKAQKSPGR